MTPDDDDSGFPSNHEQVMEAHRETHRLLQKISRQLRTAGIWFAVLLVLIAADLRR